jgi:WD40 repeat protein
LVYLKTDSVLEHEQSISDIAYFPKKNLFITSSADGYVKIWNIKKELIREIKFPEAVYSVSFLNDKGDLLVGHNGKVSMVSVDDYAPNEIPRIFSPPQDELDKFYYKNKNMVADSDTYLVLK